MSDTIDKTVVFIDGYCVLCNRLADLIVRKDHNKRMFLATLQGETFKKIKHLMNMQEIPDSVILYLNGEFHFRSGAALRIMEIMPYPYKLAKVLRVIPRPLADRAYNWLARRRYTVFGKRTECRVPSAQEKERFLE